MEDSPFTLPRGPSVTGEARVPNYADKVYSKA